jgi:hypothetical protein
VADVVAAGNLFLAHGLGLVAVLMGFAVAVDADI